MLLKALSGKLRMAYFEFEQEMSGRTQHGQGGARNTRQLETVVNRYTQPYYETKHDYSRSMSPINLCIS
jgi:hypothetical protein